MRPNGRSGLHRPLPHRQMIMKERCRSGEGSTYLVTGVKPQRPCGPSGSLFLSLEERFQFEQTRVVQGMVQLTSFSLQNVLPSQNCVKSSLTPSPPPTHTPADTRLQPCPPGVRFLGRNSNFLVITGSMG